MSVFHKKDGLYLRHPNGGIEDIADMKSAGFDYVMLGVHAPIELSDGRKFPAYSLEPWRKIIERCEAVGMRYMPWGRIMRDANCWKMRDIAIIMAQMQGVKPAANWNVESEFATGDVKMTNLVESMKGIDGMVSTEGWAFKDILYGLLPQSTVIDIQLFPSVGNAISLDPRSCRARFYKLGFRGFTRFMNGIKDAGKPASPQTAFPYQEKGLFTVFTADDTERKYTAWNALEPLTPLPEEEFPFLGPLYGPSSKYYNPAKAKSPYIRKIKRAFHWAGYWDFSNPDEAYNRNLEIALMMFQKEYGIMQTGNYGKQTWLKLRTLPSANRRDAAKPLYALRCG